jgi:hypothetical protein
LKIIPYIGLGLSIAGGYGAFGISHLHLTTHQSCPLLGIIPACYIILMAYGLMTLGWIGRIPFDYFIFIRRYRNILFWVGLVPAFLLALMGSMGEVFGFANCPHTGSGFPKCFISFGFLIILVLMWPKSLLENFVKKKFFE